ncbi:MAG: zinc ribbon domain-containing protein [Candidatus Marinimicrobia bacterium]|jgi:hypothetical protein|nr:zinc ribbon domain-containing protein [Candidatus Neomarinimicrobiota bacterium]MBT3618563.1 zinc ribbon domain-containing protein [Candidatus Neomarinimicrobiota bacterium]MBT3828790.1 zinc ribbon domain-containing protein [Candidatus Neomarinimicrobiota bacterium]MBT3996848.1 zinc ribbon domain-containing protein [Candidatus Neomarinimicrobiota bacterium]MBT4281001.1 zinc ribbon domain-containing protein [Candidatus Neomarinimicrobiota bacterium]
MKKRFLLLIIPIFAFGNDFSRFDVAVYPEYYFPGVMVEIQVEPLEGQSFPEFSMVIPSNADSAFMVGQSDESEPILLAIHSFDGESQIVIPESNVSVRIFYFYSVERKGHSVSFDVILEIDAIVADAHILIQEPMVAELFTLSEKGAEVFQDTHGLTFHRFHVKDVKPGANKSIVVSYQNTSGETTIDLLKSMLNTNNTNTNREKPNRSKSMGAIQRHTLPTWQPLTVLGALAIIIGLLFTQQRKREEHGEGKAFCTSCGSGVQPNDKFCAKCGKEQ